MARATASSTVNRRRSRHLAEDSRLEPRDRHRGGQNRHQHRDYSTRDTQLTVQLGLIVRHELGLHHQQHDPRGKDGPMELQHRRQDRRNTEMRLHVVRGRESDECTQRHDNGQRAVETMLTRSAAEPARRLKRIPLHWLPSCSSPVISMPSSATPAHRDSTRCDYARGTAGDRLLRRNIPRHLCSEMNDGLENSRNIGE